MWYPFNRICVSFNKRKLFEIKSRKHIGNPTCDHFSSKTQVWQINEISFRFWMKTSGLRSDLFCCEQNKLIINEFYNFFCNFFYNRLTNGSNKSHLQVFWNQKEVLITTWRTLSGLFVLAKARQQICRSRAKAIARQICCQTERQPLLWGIWILFIR